MRIITISREFGSGGREIGKRLADELGIAYYDKEIISEIIKTDGIDNISDKEAEQDYPISFGRTFATLSFFQNSALNMVVAEQKIIRKIAKRGEDFIIAGRSADVILKRYKPCNIFVYADMQSKIARCRKRLDKKDDMTERAIERKIKQIDSARRKHRDLVSTDKWGDRRNYNLCVNTTDLEIKNVVPSVAEFVKCYFGRRK